MVRNYSRQELEDAFAQRYEGKICAFKYPGKPVVHGMVNKVAFDHHGDLILDIGNIRYTCSLESINQVVKVIRQ